MVLVVDHLVADLRPIWVSCFPSQGFMFSQTFNIHQTHKCVRNYHNTHDGAQMCQIWNGHWTDNEKFHMPHLMQDQVWPETSKQCPSLQLMVLVVDHLVAATYGTRG